MKLLKATSSRLNRVVNNLLYTPRGQIILSIILGLGFSTLFRRFCKSNECFRFIGPKQSELRDQIFSYDTNNTTCYKLQETNVKCGTHSKIVDFA